MNKRTLLLLACITGFSANGFSQANSSAGDENTRYRNYRIFDNTTSPNNQYAIAWGLGPLVNLDEALGRGQFDLQGVENFIISLSDHKVLATLKNVHVWVDPAKENATGDRLQASWGSANDLVVVNCEGDQGSFYLRGFKLQKNKVVGSLGLESPVEKVVLGRLAKDYAAQYKRSAKFLALSYSDFEAEGENSFGLTASTVVDKTAPEDAAMNAQYRVRFFIEGAPTNLKFTLLTIEEATQGQAPKEQAATKSQTQTGTFLRIDQGDYAHWVMRNDEGEEVSFFIIQDDEAVRAVLTEPESFKNRKCEVTFKKGTENIPESGGDITISQIVSVKWL